MFLCQHFFVCMIVYIIIIISSLFTVSIEWIMYFFQIQIKVLKFQDSPHTTSFNACLL